MCIGQPLDELLQTATQTSHADPGLTQLTQRLDGGHLSKIENRQTFNLAGRRDYSTPLWTLLMFDAFLRNESGQQLPSPLRQATG